MKLQKLDQHTMKHVQGGNPAAVGIGVAVGAASGAVGKVVENKVSGKPLGEGVGRAAGAGAITGAVAPIKVAKWARTGANSAGYVFRRKAVGETARNVGAGAAAGVYSGSGMR